jgi:hypothetical protein
LGALGLSTGVGGTLLLYCIGKAVGEERVAVKAASAEDVGRGTCLERGALSASLTGVGGKNVGGEEELHRVRLVARLREECVQWSKQVEDRKRGL